MTTDIFVFGLMGITFVAVVIYMMTSKQRTETRQEEPHRGQSKKRTSEGEDNQP